MKIYLKNERYFDISLLNVRQMKTPLNIAFKGVFIVL